MRSASFLPKGSKRTMMPMRFQDTSLWLDFRMINENTLHGTGRRIENTLEGITLQIEKKAKSAGNLKAYIYLSMDAKLNIKNGEFIEALY